MRVNTVNTWPEAFELQYIRAVDGDTLDALIVFPLDVSVRRRIRLRGFFAPELNGQNPEAGERARVLLQEALDNQKCFIRTTGLKEDNHGRIVADLMIGPHIRTGSDVLGGLNLTLEQHKEDVRFARRRAVKTARAF